MRNRQQGIALITALIITVVVGIVVFGTFFTTQIELWVTRNDRASTQAYYVAQTGLHKYKAALFQAYRYIEGDSESGNPDSTVCFNQLSLGIDWQRDGSLSDWQSNRLGPYVHEVFDVSGQAIGEYSVTLLRDPSNSSVFTVESAGESAGARATLRSSFLVRNSDVLDYAIYARAGGGQRLFNGNVRIHGGLYIEGDATDPADYENVIDTNGNFTQYNDYDLTDNSRVRDHLTQANRTASNLCAALRVQHGKVKLDGSSQLGTNDNNILGLFVGRGEEDIEVHTSECQRNRGICAERVGPFDLEEAPKFPELDNEPEPRNEKCLEGESWRDCVNRDAGTTGLVIERDSAGNITLSPSGVVANSEACEVGLQDALSGNLLVLDDSPFDCTSSDGTRGIKYQDGQLQVFGTVTLRGFDVTAQRHTDYLANTTEGTSTKRNATLFVESYYENSEDEQGIGGNMTTMRDLRPDRDHMDGGQFPDHVLGLIVEKKFDQNRAGTNATNVMAPIYAGEVFRTQVQNVTIGSVLTDLFCSTSAGGGECGSGTAAGQAAQFYHVDLGNNRPALMQSHGATKPVFEHLSTERR